MKRKGKHQYKRLEKRLRDLAESLWYSHLSEERGYSDVFHKAANAIKKLRDDAATDGSNVR